MALSLWPRPLAMLHLVKSVYLNESKWNPTNNSITQTIWENMRYDLINYCDLGHSTGN